jgi:hypothetical protein
MSQITGNDLLVLYTIAELTAFRDASVSPLGQNKTIVQYQIGGRSIVKELAIPYLHFLPALANALGKLGLGKNEVLPRRRAFARFGEGNGS